MTQENKFLNPQFETDDALLNEIQDRGSLIPDVDEPPEKREVSKSEKIAGKVVDFIMPDPKLAMDIYRTGFNVATGIPRIFADTFMPALESFAPEKYVNNAANLGNKVQDGALRFYVNNAMPLGLLPLGDLTGSEHEAKKLIFDYEKNRPRYAETLAGILGVELPTAIVTGKLAYDSLNRVAPNLKKIPKLLIAEQIAEQTVFDPSYNLANLVRDFGDSFEDSEGAGKVLNMALDNPITNFLAADTEDSAALQRAKMFLTGSFAFYGAIKAFQSAGFVVKNIQEKTQKFFGKKLEDLNDKEFDEVAERSLISARDQEIRKDIQGKESEISKVRDIGMQDAEGRVEMIKQATNRNENFIEGILKPMGYRRFKRYLRARGYLSEKADIIKRKKIANQRAALSKAERIASRLQTFMNETIDNFSSTLPSSNWNRKIHKENLEKIQNYGDSITKKVSEALQENLNEIPDDKKLKYLQDKFELPDAIVGEILEARSSIDELSQVILDSNIGSEEVRKAISENMGIYLTRSYKIFQDPNFKPAPTVVKKAEDFFKRQFLNTDGRKYGDDWENTAPKTELDKAGNYARLKIKELIDSDAIKGSSVIDQIATMVSNNRALLKGRKDIPKEIMDLYGVIDDPVLSIRTTIGRLSQIVETNNYFNRLADLAASVPTNPAKYNQAIEEARDALPMDLMDFELTFNKNTPVNTFITFGPENKLGQYKGLTEDGRYRIEVKNTDGSINKFISNEPPTILPPKQAILKVADEIYVKDGGTYTKPSYFYDPLENPNDEIFSVKIQGTNSRLDGLMTTPEIAIVLEGVENSFFMNNAFNTNRFVNGWRSLKGLTQSFKTVWDHTTQLRNALGGNIMSINNGINPFKNGKTSYRILKNNISGKKGNENFNAAYEQLQKLGVINTSVRANEFMRLMRGTDDLTQEEFSDRLIKFATEKVPDIKWVGKPKSISQAAEKALRFPQKLYMATDDFFKINSFFEELDVLQRAHPNEPIEKLRELAATKVKDTMPNYDKVPPGFKAFADLPFGNFIAFTPEIVRTQYHILRVAFSEINSGNKVLRKRGIRRLSGTALVHGSAIYGSHFAYEKAGYSDKENEAIQVLSEREYANKHNLIPITIGDQTFTINPTFLNPYDFFPSIAQNALAEIQRGEFEGKDLDKQLFGAAVKSIAESMSFATDQAMLGNFIQEVTYAYLNDQGRGTNGKKIFNKTLGEATVDDIVAGLFNYGAETIAPGFILDGTKLYDAFAEVKNPRTGETRSKTSTVLEMITGINPIQFDAEDSLSAKVGQYKAALNIKSNKARVDFAETKENFAEEVVKQNIEKFIAMQTMYRYLEASKNILKPETIKGVLKSKGIGRNEANQLMRGKFMPIGISSETMDRAKKQFGRDDIVFDVLNEFFKEINGIELNANAKLDKGQYIPRAYEDFEKLLNIKNIKSLRRKSTKFLSKTIR